MYDICTAILAINPSAQVSISSEDLIMPSSDDFQTSWSGQTIAQAANRILGAGPGSYETT